jgi:hypothetical protein
VRDGEVISPVGYIHYFTLWVIFIILPCGLYSLFYPVGYIHYFTRWGGLYSLFYPVGYINYLLHITPGEERARVGGGRGRATRKETQEVFL